MRKIINSISILLGCFSLISLAVAAEISPVGFWKTIDDVTGKPKAIVEIWQSLTHLLVGRVVKIYPKPGHDQNELCAACQGVKHNQRIVGMIILENLQQSKDNPTEWQGGQILDPKNGKIYHSQLRVIENGQKLSLRGYIGLPLFGRSQTWTRMPGNNQR